MLSFTDNEPPTFSKCPKDIVREEKVSSIRVNWKRPVFSDNSGVLPSVSSSLQSGATFRVPGNYKITYTAEDRSGNENKNCTFRIILKSESYNEVGRLLVVMAVRRKPESRVLMHWSCLRDGKKFHPIPISHHILRSWLSSQSLNTCSRINICSDCLGESFPPYSNNLVESVQRKLIKTLPTVNCRNTRTEFVDTLKFSAIKSLHARQHDMHEAFVTNWKYKYVEKTSPRTGTWESNFPL